MMFKLNFIAILLAAGHLQFSSENGVYKILREYMNSTRILLFSLESNPYSCNEWFAELTFEGVAEKYQKNVHYIGKVISNCTIDGIVTCSTHDSRYLDASFNHMSVYLRINITSNEVAGHYSIATTCDGAKTSIVRVLFIYDVPKEPNIIQELDASGLTLTCSTESTSQPEALCPPMRYMWDVQSTEHISSKCIIPGNSFNRTLHLDICLNQAGVILNITCIAHEGQSKYSSEKNVNNLMWDTDLPGIVNQKEKDISDTSNFLTSTAVILSILAVLCVTVIIWLLITRKYSMKSPEMPAMTSLEMDNINISHVQALNEHKTESQNIMLRPPIPLPSSSHG